MKTKKQTTKTIQAHAYIEDKTTWYIHVSMWYIHVWIQTKLMMVWILLGSGSSTRIDWRRGQMDFSLVYNVFTFLDIS